jgi:protein-tyrosine phosphatase
MWITLNQITPQIFISSSVEDEHLKLLESKRITAIVNLMKKELYTPDFRFKYLHFPHSDGFSFPMDGLKKIYKFITHQVNNGEIVLIHCAAEFHGVGELSLDGS